MCNTEPRLEAPALHLGLRGSAGKEPACNAGAWDQPLAREDPPEEGVAAHSSILLGASLVAQPVKNPSATRGPGISPWLGKIPWRRAWQPTPAFFLGLPL